MLALTIPLPCEACAINPAHNRITFHTVRRFLADYCGYTASDICLPTYQRYAACATIATQYLPQAALSAMPGTATVYTIIHRRTNARASIFAQYVSRHGKREIAFTILGTAVPAHEFDGTSKHYRFPHLPRRVPFYQP